MSDIQEALKRFNANYVGSIYSGMVIIGGVCSGAFFFQEFRTMSPLHLVIFGGSVLISIGGTAMLTLYGDDIESLISEDDECSPLTEGTEGTMTANQEGSESSSQYGATFDREYVHDHHALDFSSKSGTTDSLDYSVTSEQQSLLSSFS